MKCNRFGFLTITHFVSVFRHVFFFLFSLCLLNDYTRKKYYYIICLSLSYKNMRYYSDSVVISYNRRYPLWQLQDVLFPLFKKDYDHESLHATIISANHIWCAYEYGQCIGCVLMTDIGSQRGLYMMLFGIRQSEQGRGIGKRLLETIVQWSQTRGYRFIFLHTEFNNKKAIRMYQSAGFQPEFSRFDYVEQLPRYGSDVMPMVLFL